MSIRFLIINIILSICSCLKFCPKTSNMNYLYLRDITYLYSSTLKFSNHRTIWASKMFEGWLNLETELITCYLTFDSCHGPLTVSPLVSFLCLKIITRQHVHEVISHHLCTSSGFLSCSLVPGPVTPGYPFVLDLIDWGCWEWARLAEIGLYSLPHFLCCPNSWKLG